MTDAAIEQRVLKRSVLLAAVLGGVAWCSGCCRARWRSCSTGCSRWSTSRWGCSHCGSLGWSRVQENRTFQYGYWHIEPMSLAFYGGMLMVLCVYASSTRSAASCGWSGGRAWLGDRLLAGNDGGVLRDVLLREAHQPRCRLGAPAP